jgi:outer membrane murein-binding lipoprotein Lpp
LSTCPHCNQEIEPANPAKVPWWKSDLAPHGVNLGCGSLILIALIVAVCSGGGGLANKMERLDTDVQKLEKKIDKLEKAVDEANQKKKP